MKKTKVLISSLFLMMGFAFFSTVTYAESNANKTGEKINFEGKANMIERNWKGQSTHGNYQNNTNSCASCHKTHTAESPTSGSSNLLFKNGTSAVCESCHDGSVQGGGDLYGHNLNAGTFGSGQDKTTGASVHAVNEGELLSSAPGGNMSPNGEWGNALSCGSCHNPHGSNSEFMLNTSIIGDSDYKQTGTQVYAEGSIPFVKTTEYVLGYFTVNNSAAPFSSGYLNELNLPNGTQVLMTYWWDIKQGKYVLDFPLWNIGKSDFDSKILESSGFTVDYKRGLAYGDSLVSTIPAGSILHNMSFGISVQPWRYPSNYAAQPSYQLKIDNRSYYDPTSPHYNSGSGRQLTKFCGQCHTDYVSYGHNYVTGIYTQASRHRTYDDAFSCSRCHFAHGTDKDMMRDASGKSIADLVNAGTMTQSEADNYMVDINDSSALKRYTGMSVCFSCHGSSSKVTTDIISSHNYAAQNGFNGGQKLVAPF
ncbi:MAG: doubled protein [Bacillales bacterium]|jgi:cytochrome c553|nr:doubled protein [Bacillales bacterium]